MFRRAMSLAVGCLVCTAGVVRGAEVSNRREVASNTIPDMATVDAMPGITFEKLVQQLLESDKRPRLIGKSQSLSGVGVVTKYCCEIWVLFV